MRRIVFIQSLAHAFERDMLGNLQSAIHRPVVIATEHPVVQRRLRGAANGVGLFARCFNRRATLGQEGRFDLRVGIERDDDLFASVTHHEVGQLLDLHRELPGLQS